MSVVPQTSNMEETPETPVILSTDQKLFIENLRKLLPQKSKLNPVAQLYECSQTLNLRESLEFKQIAPIKSNFCCECEFNGIKVVGSGTKKKEARTNSATKFIEFVMGYDKVKEEEEKNVDALAEHGPIIGTIPSLVSLTIPEISKDATTSGQKTKQQQNKNVPATQPTKTKQKKETPKTNKLQPHTLQSSDKNCKVLASCQFLTGFSLISTLY